MVMYMAFGDYFADGHKRYKQILVEAPSVERIEYATKSLKNKYGPDFMSGYANDYDNPYLDQAIWDALISVNYPIDRFQKHQGDSSFGKYHSLAEILMDMSPEEICVSIDTVIDSYLWLLNSEGA